MKYEEVLKFVDLDCITYENKENFFIDTQLILNIEDIDDLAIAWIVYEKDGCLNFYRIENCDLEDSKWLWREGGNHGEGSENITQWFHNNYEKFNCDKFECYLTVAIYDFPYKALIFKGGKCSFSAEIIIDGKIFWQKHKFWVSEDDKYGLKYLKIFRLNIYNNKIDISETIKKDIQEKILYKILKEYNYVKFDNKCKKFEKKEIKK